MRLPTAVLLVTSTLTGVASAEGLRPELRGEFGVGSIVTSVQRDRLGYELAVTGALRPGLRLGRGFVAELALGTWFFPSDAGTGRASIFGGGLRIDPRLGEKLSLFLDGHAGIGLTGPHERFMFDLGTGLELQIARGVGLGPFVRYGQMVTASSDLGPDPKFWAVGLALALTFPARLPPPPPPAPPPPPPPPAPPSDTDGDGVPDSDDQCRDLPKGERPDPLKSGCPAPDLDGDGIIDTEDRCPAQAAGPNPDPERRGCPDADDDKDGVLNQLDACRSEAAGLYPDPEKPGCPLADKDKDAVPDLHDACPDKPGAPDTNPKKNGCPGLVQIDQGTIKILRPVFFATNRDTILKRSDAVLRAVAMALKATPALRKISIEGHTDGTGVPEKNLELSQRRADSVRAWLVNNGVEAERLETKGFGDSKPITSNDNSIGRAQNRRVELVIIDPAPAGTQP